MDKRCARCRALKPCSAFYRNAGWNDSLHPYCKPCLLAYQSERRFAKLDAADPGRQQWTRRHIVHDYFHTIDNPRKAYLLGLLAADGNVLETTPRVTLELAMKDRELVEFFRDEVAPRVPLKQRFGGAGEVRSRWGSRLRPRSSRPTWRSGAWCLERR
jgi:hypothetical protein